MSFRHDVLEQLGIENEYAVVLCRDVRVQRSDESEPFAEVTTNKKGKTILRVGNDLHTKGPIIPIR